MANVLVKREQSIAFWVLFALSTMLAAGALVVLGPSVELPPAVAGEAARTKATWKLFLQPAMMIVIWFAFRCGVRANLGSSGAVGAGAGAEAGDGDADVARASGMFANTLVNAALAWAVLVFVMQIISLARMTGAEPFASLRGAEIVRGFFVAVGVIEIAMGNVWPKSAPAAAREGDAGHVHRMRRFRGWWMTLNGLTGVVCALALPVRLLVPVFIGLWLLKVVALNVAVALDGRPPGKAPSAS